jgi:hypothetical protein
MTEAKMNNILLFFTQETTAPARLAGEMRSQVGNVVDHGAGTWADMDDQSGEREDNSATRRAHEENGIPLGRAARAITPGPSFDAGPICHHTIGNEVRHDLRPVAQDDTFHRFAGKIDIDALSQPLEFAGSMISADPAIQGFIARASEENVRHRRFVPPDLANMSGTIA